MNGALATRSPSGANRAQEKSNRSLMFVLIDVCWSDLPIASATLMNRLANSVNRMGSGAFRDMIAPLDNGGTVFRLKRRATVRVEFKGA